MQVSWLHYTPEVLKTLMLFNSANALTGNWKLSAKSLDYEEKLTLHQINKYDIAQVMYILENDEYYYSLLMTVQTLTVLKYLEEHLAAKMSVDTFILEDYVLINALRNNTYVPTTTY